MPKKRTADTINVTKFPQPIPTIAMHGIADTAAASTCFQTGIWRTSGSTVVLSAMACTAKTANSAVTVPIAAPLAPYFGIKSALIITSTTAPTISETTTTFSRPIGISIWIPNILDNPIANTVGIISCIAVMLRVY